MDLDEDGTVEIVVPRDERLQIWHADGTLVRQHEVDGRIWSSPVVVDLLQREARALAAQINPFDRALRRPSEALGSAAAGGQNRS